MPEEPTRSAPVYLAALLWLGLAVGAGAAGLLQRLGPPLPQVVLLGLTAGLIAAGLGVPVLHSWAVRVDLRAVLALHLTRFVGIYFLALFREGELPFGFAVPGGWGDIVVATLALALLAGGLPRSRPHRLIWLTWNGLGFADLCFVVATAARLALADPGSMRALQRLPLSLLPTFFVPVLIASHVLIAARLVRQGYEKASPDTPDRS
jgi:hypothetical protein